MTNQRGGAAAPTKGDAVIVFLMLMLVWATILFAFGTFVYVAEREMHPWHRSDDRKARRLLKERA
jgi:hypothetical protein